MKPAQIPRRNSWIYRYPRVFVGVSTTTALLIFFSRPIYDIFFNPYQPTLEDIQREHRSKFTHK